MKPIVSGCLLSWVLLFIACPPFAEDVCRDTGDCPADYGCDPDTFRCVQQCILFGQPCPCETEADCESVDDACAHVVCDEGLCTEVPQPDGHSPCVPDSDSKGVCWEGRCSVDGCVEDGSSYYLAGDVDGLDCLWCVPAESQTSLIDTCAGEGEVCTNEGCLLGCRINGEFHQAWSHPFSGDADVVDPCLFCDPSSSTDWTVDVDEPCDDENYCTEGSTCDSSGQCTGGTQISCEDFCGECSAPATECRPMNGCECTQRAEGTACGAGGECDGAGNCVPPPCSGDVLWGPNDVCSVHIGELPNGMYENYANTAPGWAGEVNVLCSTGSFEVSTDLSSCEPLDFDWALWPIPPEDRSQFPGFVNDVVGDPITNLHWAMVQQAALWQTAIDSCSEREAGSRLPTIVELRSLVDWDAQAIRYLPNAFGGDLPEGLIFWSSTVDASDIQGDMVWTLDFGSGDAIPMSKYGSLPHLCVRSELASGPFVLFEQWGDHLLDPRTGLIWMSSHLEEGTDHLFNHQKALNNCHNFDDGSGSGSWRLPTVRELLSLLDVSRPNSMVDASFTLTGEVRVFWTRTPQRDQPADQAWTVDFDAGAATAGAISVHRGVRCVRDADLSPAP